MGKENTVSREECKLKQPEVTLVPQIVKILKLRMCQALQQALGRAGEVAKVLPLLTMAGGGGFYKLNIHTYSIASSLKSF